ncbi:hypothetical protein LCGC14_0893440 [marine sediment metagenome]|uniref:DNA-directed DNA polymerase family A palm domain-containing protein n=1 Tax=marine sediment metagenome TaxID=412755 RepID=A0A0F9NYK4_9ZZZZ
MDLITLDFETYYDKEYELSKMLTEDYICDDRFEVMMVGLKLNSGPSKVYSFPTINQYAQVFEAINLRGNAMLCHHTAFDGLILALRFGIIPPMLLDTLGMAQALLKPYLRSVGLASCLKHCDLGVQKGTYVGNMKGRRLSSLSPTELGKYARYCADDCGGEYALFQHLVKQLPRRELEIIDMTLRMYLEPQFELDHGTLAGVYTDTVNKKAELLSSLPPGVEKKDLMSNPKLAQILEGFGVIPPIKISPTTNKPAFAFAKTDPGWKDLEDEYEDDPLIASILAARTGVKSTLAETRAKRLMSIALNHPMFRVPLRFYAAHTGRYGGTEKINCQNFTRIKPKLKHRRQLRYAVKAPKGHSILAADLSQIEVRINAWLSNCLSLLTAFRAGRDPYCEFGSIIFHRTITKADIRERFIAKTCILGLGYGMGWKKLQATLRKDGIKLTNQEAYDYVNLYRNTYREITNNWRQCDSAIEIIAHGGKMMLGPCQAIYNKILLPNGMALVYHNLRYVDSKKYKGWTYDFGGQGRTLWGGTIIENICQALGRIIVMEQMLTIKKALGLRPALQAHDELVYVVPTPQIATYKQEILRLMRIPPGFAPDLPIDAEANHGPTYGDAK